MTQEELETMVLDLRQQFSDARQDRERAKLKLKRLRGYVAAVAIGYAVVGVFAAVPAITRGSPSPVMFACIAAMTSLLFLLLAINDGL